MSARTSRRTPAWITSRVDTAPTAPDAPQVDTAHSPTDLELLQAWRDGDAKKGNALFQRYFSTVHRYFANKVSSERDVEDLIQRTFLACTESRHRFAGESTFRTWLIGIAQNVLREHYRKVRKHGNWIEFSEVSVHDLCDGPSTLLRQKLDHQALLEALRTIPLKMQVVLELYYWEHFTGPELGNFLGVNESTARSRLRHAKERLLDAIRGNPQSPRQPRTEQELDDWAAQVRDLAFDQAG
jgi:RNA polymerase sigma factor (sigma-70 family)